MESGHYTNLRFPKVPSFVRKQLVIAAFAFCLAMLCVAPSFAGKDSLDMTVPVGSRLGKILTPGSGPTGISPARVSSSLDEDYSAKNYRLKTWLPTFRILSDHVDSTLRKMPPLKPRTPIPWVARQGLSAQEYQAAFDRWLQAGYRLKYVSGYESGGEERFAAIWDQSTGPEWTARYGMSSEDYQRELEAQRNRGFRPVLVNGYTLKGTDRYVAIWEKDSGVEWIARHGLTSSQYQQEFDQHFAQGYRLVHISGYAVGGEPRYATIWDKSEGPQWIARYGMSSKEYQFEFDERAASDYRLKTVSGYYADGQYLYAAIWEQDKGDPWIARHGLSPEEYQLQFDDLRYQGYRPVGISGYSDGRNSEQYAAIWRNDAYSFEELSLIDGIVEQARKKWELPAISFAVAKDGRLVFAKAYGFADASGNPVHANSLFRIASLSKPITSAAVLRLIEDGKLRLSDRVFGPDGILGTDYSRLPAIFGGSPLPPYLDRITIKDLLQHTSGGWPNRDEDPMYQHPEFSRDALIAWTLRTRPLDNIPGTMFAYSNFGYCLLGRVIERVTGQTYEGWVRDNILTAAGISDMAIAGNTLEAKSPREVSYFAADDDAPYEIDIHRADSAGGWIASAIDLVRFGVRTDGLPTKPDLFQDPDTVTRMTTPWREGEGYALGWEALKIGQDSQWWHDGKLPGTSSFLERTFNGYVFAVVANSRDLDPDFRVMGYKILDGIDAIGFWPDLDLFNEFSPYRMTPIMSRPAF